MFYDVIGFTSNYIVTSLVSGRKYSFSLQCSVDTSHISGSNRVEQAERGYFCPFNFFSSNGTRGPKFVFCKILYKFLKNLQVSNLKRYLCLGLGKDGKGAPSWVRPLLIKWHESLNGLNHDEKSSPKHLMPF